MHFGPNFFILTTLPNVKAFKNLIDTTISDWIVKNTHYWKKIEEAMVGAIF